VPLLGVFVTWLTGFPQSYPSSSRSYGLPFPWKSITYSGGRCSSIGLCTLLASMTSIDWNAFAIDATLFSAAGYAVLIVSYAMMMRLSDKTPLFFGRIGSVFYYTLIPVCAVFVTLITGSWSRAIQVWQGFPFSWRSGCPGLLVGCGLPSFDWLPFALDTLIYSVTWYFFHLAYSRFHAGNRLGRAPRTVPPQ